MTKIASQTATHANSPAIPESCAQDAAATVPDLVQATWALLALIRRNAPDLSGKVMGDAEAAIQRAEVAHTAPQVPALVPLLADEHNGMRVDYAGLLGQCQHGLAERNPGHAEMLRQLQEHLRELGQRWYAGDAAVVDELLQLYCIEHDARKAVKARGR